MVTRPNTQQALSTGDHVRGLAHNTVQYTDDLITPLGLLHKEEHERQRAETPSGPSRERLSAAFTNRTN